MKTLLDVLNHEKTYCINREYKLEGDTKFRTTEIGWLEGIDAMPEGMVKLLVKFNFRLVDTSYICIHDRTDATVMKDLENARSGKVIHLNLDKYVEAYKRNYINGKAQVINTGLFKPTLLDWEILKHVIGEDSITDCGLVIKFVSNDYFEIKQYNHTTKTTTIHKVNKPLSREALWDFKIDQCRAAFLWDLDMDVSLLEDYKRTREASRRVMSSPEDKAMYKAVKELRDLVADENTPNETILRSARYIVYSPELDLLLGTEI